MNAIAPALLCSVPMIALATHSVVYLAIWLLLCGAWFFVEASECVGESTQ